VISTELMTRLRKELEDERAAAIEQLRTFGADPHSEKVDRIAGIDDNFADSAAATTERGEVLALIDQTRERLAAVEEALARMDDGTYGSCANCGRPIPEARLEARPLAVLCVDCASQR
jgi:RNA polymerase-binding protein DksA